MAGCTHLAAHRAAGPDASPRAERCEACGAAMNLRTCLTCGHVGCCESQQGHNTAHARASGHPLIQPLGGFGRRWTWCYACDAYV